MPTPLTKFWATEYWRTKVARTLNAEPSQARVPTEDVELAAPTLAEDTPTAGLSAASRFANAGVAMVGGSIASMPLTLVGTGIGVSALRNTTTRRELNNFQRQLAPVMGGEDVTYDSSSKGMPHYNPLTRTVVPGISSDKAILAHEYGHATGLGKNKAYRIANTGATMAGRLGGGFAPMVAAIDPDSTEARAMFAGLSQLPVLAEEARASWRARNALKQLGAWTPSARNKLLQAYSSYGINAVRLPLTTLAAGQLRRSLDEDSLEELRKAERAQARKNEQLA